MRIYESLFIIKPDVPEEEVNQRLEALRGQLTASGATVEKLEPWAGGKRKLAYKIDKYREGLYVLAEFTAGAEVVKEFERRLRVSDVVLKFLTVRVDLTRKRLDKRKKMRDKRAARRAASAPAASPAPAQPSIAHQMSEAPAMPGMPKEG